MQVVVHPPVGGRPAHYVVLRPVDAGRPVLLGSGSEDTLAACL